MDNRMSENVVKAMENCKVELTASRETLAEVNIQMDSFFLLLFHSNYATWLYTKKMYKRLQIYKVAGNYKPSHV